MGPYINTNVVISHVMVHNDMVPFKVELLAVMHFKTTYTINTT